MSTTPFAGAAERTGAGGAASGTGVFPAQMLREAIASDWIVAGDWRIPQESVQPASIDLRLGDHAWALRCSFLPDSDSTVEEKVQDLAFEKIDLRDGVTLERDRPYLVPLIEGLRLPAEVRAKANPKSSTGRLDVFTRVLTDRNHRFDEIAAGYSGGLYLEVVPRTFAIRVKTGLALNQVRLMSADARLSDEELIALHAECPLLYRDGAPVPDAELSLGDGLFVSLDVSGPAEASSATAPRRTASRSTSRRWARCAGRTSGSRCTRRAAGRIVLEPEVFYLLLSAEGVSIPPMYAAEMLAYDPTAGELRTHYAGLLRPRVRLLRRRRAGRQPRGARGARPRRLVHGRAPPARLQARVRADGPGAGCPLRHPDRLQLPGSADDAEQALH